MLNGTHYQIERELMNILADLGETRPSSGEIPLSYAVPLSLILTILISTYFYALFKLFRRRRQKNRYSQGASNVPYSNFRNESEASTGVSGDGVEMSRWETVIEANGEIEEDVQETSV